jgi:hypothetical protein
MLQNEPKELEMKKTLLGIALMSAQFICVPSMLADGNFTPVPLDSVCNRDLVDDTPEGDGKGGWSDQGRDNCLNQFPRGKITLRDIPFQIPEKGNAAIMFKGLKLANLANIAKDVAIKVPAGAKGSNFYILACFVWGARDGEDVADLTVKFANGDTEEQRMVFGRHVSGWWAPVDITKAVIAWKGKNGQNADVGVYLIAYSPKKSTIADISEIKISANDKNEGSLAVIGLTVGDKKAEDILPPPLVWKDWEDNGTDGWFTIPSKYDDASQPAPWDDAMEFFKQPAGSLGWTVANGENLEFEKSPGKPVRFKGICATGNGFYPFVAEADKYAKILRKYGFNQVRFHSLLDTLMVQKEGEFIIPELNKARMEKFDKYFAALKAQGIYVKISGTFGARWAKETGVEAYDKIGGLNNTQYTFDEKHQELYLKALKLFLEHVNPYTKMRYADDPAFNMYKVVNESSLFFNQPSTLPGYYAVKFQDKYNAWLKKKYENDIRLIGAWMMPNEAKPMREIEGLDKGTVAILYNYEMATCKSSFNKRVIDQTMFFYETETEWFRKVESMIRATGSKVMVQGSSWGGPGHLQEIQTAVSANFDFAGKHTYWLHPQGGWSPEAALFPNEPVVKHAPDHLLQCAYQHVAGKPFAVTEWNFCFPNDYTLDAAPFMAAYGALQNINANHRFNIDLPEMGASKRTFFGIFDSPSGLATEPMSYFMYVRGDVKSAPVIYQNNLAGDKLFDPDRKRNIKQASSSNRFFMNFDPQQVPNEVMLAGGVRISLDEKKYPAIWDEKAYQKCIDEKAKTVTSVTDEIVWNYGDSYILIKTPKTRGFIGFTGGKSYDNGPLKMKLSKAYGVIGFCSLDNKPLEESSRILVTVASRDRNSGQALSYLSQGGKRIEKYESFKMDKVGGAPLIYEPLEMDFNLKSSSKAKWSATPVDIAGKPMVDRKIAVSSDGGAISGKISNKGSASMNFILSEEK